jgi:hypothetical protein
MAACGGAIGIVVILLLMLMLPMMVVVVATAAALPKADVAGQTVQLEFTMVTKEWSPAMLDHYKLSELSMDVKTRMWV